MELFRSTESKIDEDKNDENVLHLEITAVVLVNCSIVNTDFLFFIFYFFYIATSNCINTYINIK